MEIKPFHEEERELFRTIQKQIRKSKGVYRKS